MKRRDVLLAALGLAIVWQVTAMIVNRPILPAPWDVLVVFVKELSNGLLIHFGVSLWRVTAGMLISVLVAAPAGLAIGASKTANRLLSPIIYLLYPIPKVVFVPVVLLFLGIGDTAKITLIVLILFFQIIVLVRDQAVGIPPQLLQSLQSLPASKFARNFDGTAPVHWDSGGSFIYLRIIRNKIWAGILHLLQRQHVV
jgi:ABC-type nitrate/sulfonate/bicarbonate transport system permease component